ncbi:hypothetical protein RYA05_01690 [Pseudomonas syringae pv. actinidiae]|nr:hypothetical protein [Pseudomonas syringae pv. actinidiae]
MKLQTHIFDKKTNSKKHEVSRSLLAIFSLLVFVVGPASIYVATKADYDRGNPFRTEMASFSEKSAAHKFMYSQSNNCTDITFRKKCINEAYASAESAHGSEFAQEVKSAHKDIDKHMVEWMRAN